MKLVPSRYTQPKEIKVKRGSVSQITHVSVPLKGLSLDVKLSTKDPQLGPILTNFTVEDDRIQSRAGYVKISRAVTQSPIERLIPYYGSAPTIMAATGHQLCHVSDGTTIRTGFTSDDWMWTSFSNLGDKDYTVMVNGSDGVWSWSGDFITPAPVSITKISHTNPTEITVASTDIGKFANGMVVKIAGADAAHDAANGSHVITSVGAPANGFKLVGVDTSGAAVDQNTGATVDPAQSLQKEAVTAPASATWVNPNQLALVVSHQNRLFFADQSHLAFYYLPLMQKSGELKAYPLNAIFRRGGQIRAMASWTVDGGTGMDDNLVLFSSNGECVIFQGTNPDTAETWSLIGNYSFEAPMSKSSIVKFGGDLYVLCPTGLLPMTTLMRAESEKLGTYDKTVTQIFTGSSYKYRTSPGWQAFLVPSAGKVYCNLPQGAPNKYWQAVRMMTKSVWSKYENIPARTWGWIDPYVYFGDDDGNLYQLHPQYLNDNGQAIKVDMQTAWSTFGYAGIKHFKMVNTYLITDGDPSPYIDVKCDFDYSDPENQPQLPPETSGAIWNTAKWDSIGDPHVPEDLQAVGDFWASGPTNKKIVNGVSGTGHRAGIRVTCLLSNCSLALTGFDIVYEPGSFY